MTFPQPARDHSNESIMKLKTLLLVALLPFAANATPNRGLWFWGNTTIPDGIGGTTSSPYGASLVVGNPVLERDCLAFFKLHHVKRIYGSYGTRPQTAGQIPIIASWNEKLDCLRIDSQILISGSTVTTPAHINVYLAKITNRLINFNNLHVSEPRKQFDALHLDIEPQQQAAWQSGTSTDKRAFLGDLLNTFTAIRAHLDADGYADFPIYADIPYTWDKFPGSIAWADATDRDNWFLDLKDVLTGLSIMTFSKTNAPALDLATAYERAGALDGFSRIGIQPKVGDTDETGIYWPDYPTFNGVLHDLEALVEHDETTDIENFGLWRHAIDSTGLGYILRNRGLWFWEHNSFEDETVSIYDGLSVVGHLVRETEAINFIKNRHVRRLFGEYTNRPVTEPAVIAAWNTKLHQICIESESLFRTHTVHTALAKAEMLDDIQSSFIDYMDLIGADLPSQFDALRLHLAPQKNYDWPTWGPTFRRSQLNDILDILSQARSKLDTTGYFHIPLFADIDPRWDLLPIDGGLIGWADATDRDNWFQQLHQIVDGVSILSFYQTTEPTIQNVTNYERVNTLPTKARIGMKPHLGVGAIWPNLSTFENVMEQVEDNAGPADSVDLDNYARWRKAIAADAPILTGTGVNVLFDFDKPDRPIIHVEVKPNHLYLVRFSTDLQNPRQAREVARLRTKLNQPEKMSIPIETQSKSGFWLVERIKD
ncbi:MAG: hypothetical protein ACJAQT_004251 [Akkermansiaceae bacterium]|jgi:hypothetical protein